MLSAYSAWYFWIVVLIAVVLTFALTLIIMMCCRKPNKMALIHISSPMQSSMLAIGKDERGLIQPDVVFFRRPSTALSFAQLSSERRASDNSELLECDDIETVDETDDTSVRLKTPLKPLCPAYQLSEPLDMSKVRFPQILCPNQTNSELTLPPGYVTTMFNANNKN